MCISNFASTIETLRTHSGEGFLDQVMSSFLSPCFGIIHEATCPHTLEQNGVTEKKHAHLIGATTTLLQQACSPKEKMLISYFHFL